jgi:hypothetical protein
LPVRWGLSRQGRIESNEVLLPFPLALGKGETNLFARWLVFLIYVFNEGLEVGEGFFGHVVLFICIKRYGANCSIGLSIKPN